jgi:YD repeat-containing protein
LGVERYLTSQSFSLTDRVSARASLCNGNLIAQYNAFTIPSRGLQLHLVFTYNSLTNVWTHTYAASLADQTNGDVIYTDGDGTQHLFTHQANGSYDPPAGIFDTFVKNGDDSFTLTHTDQSAHRFEPNPSDATTWRLYAIRDRHNNAVTLTYSNGALQQVTAAAGQSLQFFYYPDGNLQKVEDNYTPARALTLAYQPNGRLKTFTDPMGFVTEFNFSGGHLEQLLDPRPQHDATDFGYDANDKLYTITRHRLENGTPVAVPVATFTYNGSTTTFTDGNQHDTVYDLYPNGQVQTVTDELAHATTYTYHADLNVHTIDAPNGRQTIFTYDARGNLESQRDIWNGRPAIDQTAHYAYTATNDLRFTWDALGHQTEYQYQNGNLTAVIDPLGNRTEYEYYPNGQRHYMRDARAVAEGRTDKTEYIYDSAGYLWKVIDPLTHTTTYTYDGDGNVTQVTLSWSGDTYVTTYTWEPGTYQLRAMTRTKNGSGEYSATFEYDRFHRIRTFCENGATGSACQSFHYMGESDWLSYVSQYNTILQRYLYANGKPLRADIRYISTLYPNYYRYNARGDAAAIVQQNGDGGASWTNYGAWGDANYSATGYYGWNAAWGYMQFPANLNFNLHGGYDMGLYYAHGRWYNQDTGLWLSPWEMGDYLYGGHGQDPVNTGWTGDEPLFSPT